MRSVCIALFVTLGVGCSDPPPPTVDAAPTDAPQADLADGAVSDASPDAPLLDLRPDGPPPIPCATHYDCPQGSYCYYKGCVTDPNYPVYHCNKKDSSGNDTCPPGHTCVDKAGKTSICAESNTYTCNDACDCGPAHCCKLAVSGTKRCVKDTNDPWLPGGTATGGATCVQGTDATYCALAPACHEGRQAFAVKQTLGSFLAYDPNRKATAPQCSGKSCFGTVLNCNTGEQCIDTLQKIPLPGKACLLLAGGSCVSNALAESVFGYKPADLLPRCSPTCPKGKKCDAGWVSDRKFAYKRIVGTCGSCGNGTCDPGEWHNNCPKDCDCGDNVCGPGENQTCFQDCSTCGNKVCDPGETIHFDITVGTGCISDCTCGNGSCDPGETQGTWPCPGDCSCGDGICGMGEVCPQDCVCSDSHDYFDRGRICGDKKCDRDRCTDLESCLSCPYDCDPCGWRVVQRSARLGLPQIKHAAAAWGDLSTGIHVVGETNKKDGVLLIYKGGKWTSHGPFPSSGIWGASSTDIFAAGAGNILHYDGKVWSPMVLPTSSWAPPVERVWGKAAGDIYAVGPELLHYDGNAQLKWERIASIPTYGAPPPPSGPAPIEDVWGPSGANEVYVAANDAIYHCKVGTKSCSKMKSPSPGMPGPIWPTHISGAKSGTKLDIFSAGECAIWHYDGNAAGAWTSMTLPPLAPLISFRDLWARSGDDVFAVGNDGLIAHYDGKVWTKQSSPVSDTLWAVWGNAVDTFALVSTTGAILRRDATTKTWKVLATPEEDKTDRATPGTGVWGTSAADVYAVNGTGVLHYDGKTWKAMNTPPSARLHGIWGSSGSDILAVGGKLSVSGSATSPATVLHHDGTSWSTAPAPSVGPLFDVWGGKNDYYSVGMGGKLWHYNGTAWKELLSLSDAKWLSAVWGCSATQVAAVGRTAASTSEGFLVVYDVTTKGFTPIIIKGVTHLHDVWCDAKGTIIATGSLIYGPSISPGLPKEVQPMIVTCTTTSGGMNCKAAKAPLPRRLYSYSDSDWVGLNAVWAVSANEIYAVGVEGAVLRYDGTAWKHAPVDIRTASYTWGCTDLLGIWGTKNDLFISTTSGAMHLERLP